MKTKVILFGAGSAGEKFLNNSNLEPYELIAFSDNNAKLWGDTFCNLPVISPNDINDTPFDKVIITSFWADSIQNQLINELLITPDKIEVASKASIKESPMPFTEQATLELARECMGNLSEYLIECGAAVCIDFGTLLGLVRDGDIIPWDDDIDFAVNEDDFDALIEHMKNFPPRAPKRDGIKWLVSVVSRAGINTSIRIEFVQTTARYNNFKIGIAKRRHIDGHSVLLALGGMLYAPSYHFEHFDKITAFGYTFLTPTNAKEYLSFVYGDWQTPRKGMTFQDYNNKREPEKMNEATRFTTSKVINSSCL